MSGLKTKPTEQKTYNKKGARRALVEQLVNLDTKILEIGALNSPTFKKSEANVEFADWLSHEDLIEHYDAKKGIIEVDHVIKGRNISAAVKCDQVGRFDLVIANHVIEHIPDVIGWLQELSKITTPDGHLSLAVPDRRYTFDIARHETDVADLMDCYRDQLEVPTFRQILKHLFFKKNIVARDIWDSIDVLPQLSEKRFSLQAAVDRAEQMVGSFHSLHCHVFTKSSFVDLMDELAQAGYIAWQIEKVVDVQRGGNEFLVLLKSTAGDVSPKYPLST